MRMLLSLVLVLVMAGSAQAQQQTPPASTSDLPAADARLDAPATVNLQRQTTELKTVQPMERQSSGEATTGVVAEATSAAYATAVLRQDPTTRSWWWLVAAIVVAGVIVVALVA